AAAAPSLAMLAAVGAPIETEATVDLDAKLALHAARLTLHAGAGRGRGGNNEIPILEGGLVASGHLAAFEIQTARLSLRGHDGGVVTHLQTHGTVQRSADHLTATASADLDQLDFADLGRLWPEGTGGGARRWLVANIPVGMARNGHV